MFQPSLAEAQRGARAPHRHGDAEGWDRPNSCSNSLPCEINTVDFVCAGD